MLLLSLLGYPAKGGAEPQIISPEPIPTVQTTKKVASRKTTLVKPVATVEMKELIEDIFGDKAKIATAVLMHESGLNLEAKGWNCHYYDKDGKRYSKACKKEDRPKAWSVDCGIAQVNIKGKVCPKELLTLEGNMLAVAKIYKSQGLNAWVSYKTGSYKKYLD